jgi:hypothetical protein
LEDWQQYGLAHAAARPIGQRLRDGITRYLTENGVFAGVNVR